MAVCFVHGSWCVSGDLPVTWQDRHPSTQHCTHRIVVPQTCPQLIAEACDHVTLYGDRGSADREKCRRPGVITGSSKKVAGGAKADGAEVKMSLSHFRLQ